ncbi:hypothetical protein KFE94_17380 [bacterium SCSIO 12643]|nr:hypothetical protein KFE94_17380 [bacterium SCSIO 12643]
MKIFILIIGILTLSFSTKAQYIGKTLDITHNYDHSYIEAEFEPNTSYIMIYWGNQNGLLKNQDRKNMKFRSYAAFFEYLEQFGWIYMERFPIVNSSVVKIIFKREPHQH